MAIRGGGAIAVPVLALVVLSACSSREPAPKPTYEPTVAGTVPPTAQRVYLATAVGCDKLGSARFTPLTVKGPNYSAIVKPTQGCKEQQIFSSYVYDVPLPATGRVTLTPGNQPAAEIQAAKVTKHKAVTVYYGHIDGDHYKVTVIEYDKSDDVADAGR